MLRAVLPAPTATSGAAARAADQAARYRNVHTRGTLPVPMMKDYLARSRAPRYSILFALPLLVLYEVSAFALTGSAFEGVRNGADVLLKSVFVMFGGRDGLIAFDVLLLGIGAFLVVRDKRKNRAPWQGGTFALMFGESAVYAVAFGAVVSRLTALVLGVPSLLQVGGARLSLGTQLVTSLGAGIYEELLFRVIITGGLLVGVKILLGWEGARGKIVAVLVSALIFSAFHYIGAYGDRFTAQSFVFRAIAGVIFSALFVTRGLGITAWTHALYDLLITVLQSSS